MKTDHKSSPCHYVTGELIKKKKNKKNFFFFFNQNMCCVYSKEPSQRDGSLEHPKQMLKLVGKKILIFLRSKYLWILTYALLP